MKGIDAFMNNPAALLALVACVAAWGVYCLLRLRWETSKREAKREEFNQNEYELALAFASLECFELKAGKRERHQCPGIVNLAKYVSTP